MTGPTITYHTSFRRKAESRLTALPSPPCAPVAGPVAPARSAASATPIARQLALAHHVERLVEAGKLKDYADAARRLGMAKSHVTHITNLLSLAPDIQEAILLGPMDIPESRLRRVCGQILWDEQRRSVTALAPRG